jgi:hypothetical protein
VPSGFAALDGALHWGGWPAEGLCELLGEGAGEGLGLVLPALAWLSAAECRWVLLVAPPWQPFAPALAARGLALERLVLARAGERAAWAAEQGLRSGACSAVLLWGGRWDLAGLRRLQLAATSGGALAFLFRDPAAARSPSPAVLRLAVGPAAGGQRVEVLKQRGGRPGAVLVLADSDWPRLGAGLPRSTPIDADRILPGVRAAVLGAAPRAAPKAAPKDPGSRPAALGCGSRSLVDPGV